MVKELSDDELKFMNSEWAKNVVKNHSLSELASVYEELKVSKSCVDIVQSEKLSYIVTASSVVIDSSESLQEMIDLCEQMGWKYNIENP
jgi:hypothetical protein